MTALHIDNPGATLETAFRKRLIRMISSIRDDAEGKTCGDCIHHVIDTCSRHESPFTGNALKSEGWAAACGQYEKR